MERASVEPADDRLCFVALLYATESYRVSNCMSHVTPRGRWCDVTGLKAQAHHLRVACGSNCSVCLVSTLSATWKFC